MWQDSFLKYYFIFCFLFLPHLIWRNWLEPTLPLYSVIVYRRKQKLLKEKVSLVAIFCKSESLKKRKNKLEAWRNEHWRIDSRIPENSWIHQPSIGDILWQCLEEVTRSQRKLLCGMHMCTSFMRHSHPSRILVQREIELEEISVKLDNEHNIVTISRWRTGVHIVLFVLFSFLRGKR